jgi:hypothetical protein
MAYDFCGDAYQLEGIPGDPNERHDVLAWTGRTGHYAIRRPGERLWRVFRRYSVGLRGRFSREAEIAQVASLAEVIPVLFLRWPNSEISWGPPSYTGD